MKVSRKKLPRVRISPAGEVVFASIALAGAITVFAMFPGVAVAIAPFLKKKKYSVKQTVQRNIDSLIRSGLVKRSLRKNGDIRLELTQRGKWEALIRFGSKDTVNHKWDGVWRVVIFDVPNTKNDIRFELRRAMVLYGFKMLQQSVWVYPYACDDFIDILKSHLGVASDVLYMKVNYIENDKILREEFGVKHH